MAKEDKIVFCTGGGCTAKLGAGVLSHILAVSYTHLRPYDRDILVRVLVPKEHSRFVYQSVRNSQTDFPVVGALGVLSKRHDAALIKLYGSVQREEHGEHVGETETAVNAAAHRCV